MLELIREYKDYIPPSRDLSWCVNIITNKACKFYHSHTAGGSSKQIFSFNPKTTNVIQNRFATNS